jgi:DNA polymerase III subunit delta'
LRLHAAGLDAKHWSQWPRALARGDTQLPADWSPAQLVEGLQKLCHDVLAVRTGAEPRFFAVSDLPAGGSVAALTGWWRDLAESAKTAEHPFNAGLMLESLVARARSALHSKPAP